MSILMAFAVLLALALAPLPSEARHEEVGYYRLLVEEPAEKISSELAKEFRYFTILELAEHFNRQEIEGKELYRIPPEVFRPLGAGMREFSQNGLMILSEHVYILGKARDLYEKYGYPRIEMKVLDKEIRASMSKPSSNPLGGFRLGVSVDLENPSSPADVLTPVPYLKCDFGPFNCRVRYNILSETLRVSLENSSEGLLWGVLVRGILEMDFKEKRERAELVLIKSLPQLEKPWMIDPFLKLRFRHEIVTRDKDRFWKDKDFDEIVLFFQFRF